MRRLLMGRGWSQTLFKPASVLSLGLSLCHGGFCESRQSFLGSYSGVSMQGGKQTVCQPPAFLYLYLTQDVLVHVEALVFQGRSYLD